VSGPRFLSPMETGIETWKGRSAGARTSRQGRSLNGFHEFGWGVSGQCAPLVGKPDFRIMSQVAIAGGDSHCGSNPAYDGNRNARYVYRQIGAWRLACPREALY